MLWMRGCTWLWPNSTPHSSLNLSDPHQCRTRIHCMQGRPHQTPALGPGTHMHSTRGVASGVSHRLHGENSRSGHSHVSSAACRHVRNVLTDMASRLTLRALGEPSCSHSLNWHVDELFRRLPQGVTADGDTNPILEEGSAPCVSQLAALCLRLGS